MANLADITCQIELSPEVKEELDKLQAKLDLLLEKLDTSTVPAQFKISASDLSRLVLTEEQREALLIKQVPLSERQPYFGDARAL